MGRERSVIAWVESPLQFVGAVEWAHSNDARITIASRVTAQMEQTAHELLARRAPIDRVEPYLGIPWSLLSRSSHWLIGDGFSGQFRLAATALRPRRLTFLDDGANTLALADSITGRRAFHRPGVDEQGLTARLAAAGLEGILRSARRGGTDVFTAFELGDARRAALEEHGIPLHLHRFDWTRHAAPASAHPSRVLLGSVGPTDGRIPLADYLDWVRAEVGMDAVTYLPHRRESADQLARVAAIPGVIVTTTGLPVELVLAGTRHPIEVVTLASSATSTLALVLDGTGSTVRTSRLHADAEGGR